MKAIEFTIVCGAGYFGPLSPCGNFDGSQGPERAPRCFHGVSPRHDSHPAVRKKRFPFIFKYTGASARPSTTVCVLPPIQTSIADIEARETLTQL